MVNNKSFKKFSNLKTVLNSKVCIFKLEGNIENLKEMFSSRKKFISESL